MSIDFTEKAKRYQAIDEIIASGRNLKWNKIISELKDEYDIKTSRSSFFRDIEELLASGENNLHESGEINQKKSKEKSHYQF